MITFLSSLKALPWKAIGIGALVLSLLLGGYWFRGVLSDREELQAEVTRLEAQNRSLAAQKAQADKSLREAVKAQQEARNQAAEALEKLKNADTQEDRDWKSTPIPGGVLDSLK